MALAMLSTYSAPRLARALAEKDLAALTQVTGVGRKKAERLALELAEKVEDLAMAPSGTPGLPPGAEGAVAALVALGYSPTKARDAVSAALKTDATLTTEELIREALAG